LSELFDDSELDLETPQDVVIDPEEIPFVKFPIPVLQQMGKMLGPLGIATYIGLRSFANRQRGMTAFPAVKTIAELIGIGVSTVRREIGKMEEMGLLTRKQNVGHSTTYFITPVLQMVEGGLLQCGGGSSTLWRHNQKNLTRRKEPEVSVAKLPYVILDQPSIEDVFNYYISKMEKHPKLYLPTQKRLQTLQRRFGECLHMTGGDKEKAIELMKTAIDNCANSEFHMGKNEQGKKYNDLISNIFKSYEQMEKWWND
jgi:hypothetical protein